MNNTELTGKEKKCREIDREMTRAIPNEEIVIVFNKNTTHQDVIRQFVDKLFCRGFASRKEIIENLQVADILMGTKKNIKTKENL